MHIKEYHSLTSKSLRKLKELRGEKSTACRKLENGFQEFEGSNQIILSKEEGRWERPITRVVRRAHVGANHLCIVK